jgi:hypothetical protein
MKLQFQPLSISFFQIASTSSQPKIILRHSLKAGWEIKIYNVIKKEKMKYEIS